MPRKRTKRDKKQQEHWNTLTSNPTMESNHKNKELKTEDDEEKMTDYRSSSEGEEFEEFDAHSYQLSELELLQKENVKKNMEMFQELNMDEAKNALSSQTSKRKIAVVGAEIHAERKKLKREEVLNQPRRISLRIRKKTTELLSLPPDFVEPKENYGTSAIEDRGRKPDIMPMNDVNNIGDQICSHAVQSWSKLFRKDVVCKDNHKSKHADFDEYMKTLTSLNVHKVGKVTKSRIFSMAIHPAVEKTIIVAGDKWGGVGIWDLDSSADGNSEIFMFEPHTRPINCIKFSPQDSKKLFSCSYDGTIRYGDFAKETFYQVYGFAENENKRFNYFAWLKDKNNTLLSASSNGDVLLIDINSGKLEQSFDLFDKSVRCIDCHPLNENMFAASCYDGTIATWDIRHLSNKKRSKPLSLFQASRTTSSCFFSPITGNKLLLTAQDNLLRVFDVNNKGYMTTPPKWSFKHNNNTGRWLTTFRACWDPLTDNCFLSGSMAQPRQLDLYYCTENPNASSCFSICDENLTTVNSVNAFHPSQKVIAGGNASGKVYVWT